MYKAMARLVLARVFTIDYATTTIAQQSLQQPKKEDMQLCYTREFVRTSSPFESGHYLLGFP